MQIALLKVSIMQPLSCSTVSYNVDRHTALPYQ